MKIRPSKSRCRAFGSRLLRGGNFAGRRSYGETLLPGDLYGGASPGGTETEVTGRKRCARLPRRFIQPTLASYPASGLCALELCRVVVSRAGFEPATHRLKVCCSTN